MRGDSLGVSWGGAGVGAREANVMASVPAKHKIAFAASVVDQLESSQMIEVGRGNLAES
jgi:hypothetical protein